MADIFAIQSEVAQQVASALKAAISPEVKKRIEAPPTENLEAFELYLKGNSFFDFTVDGIYRAMEYYNQAIALDENLADAYVGLGRCNWYLAHFGGVPPRAFLDSLQKCFGNSHHVGFKQCRSLWGIGGGIA